VSAHTGGGSVTLYEANGTTPRVIPSVAAQGLGVPAFIIKDNGSTVTAYTIDNTTGKVSFTSAPTNGHILTWSGEFDTPMAFSDNSFPITKFDVSSEVKGVRFEELLPITLGITV
jgi:hypothetical protein